jgi:hypothetical protein
LENRAPGLQPSMQDKETDGAVRKSVVRSTFIIDK